LSRLVGVLISAKNGLEGVDAYQKHHPDIVVTDIQMPFMDGLAMVQEIRNFEISSGGKPVQVLVVTAFEEFNFLKRSINLGVRGYVNKPLDVRQFHSSLLECARGLLIEKKLQKVQEDLLEQKLFIHAIIDGLSAHICVVDSQGSIIMTNRAWKTFASENNAAEGACGEGANYLQAFRTISETEHADIDEFAAGLQAVFDGSLSEFVKEYPCHSPDKKRWFLCRVNRFTVAGRNHAVISHENITG
jgi:YesN/AraC family two-component response regulator